MASPVQHSGRELDTHGPDEPVPVALDPNFVRTFADHAFVMHLGRDVDLSFLAVGSSVKSVLGIGDDSRETVGLELGPQLNEVARVRLAPLTAITLAMQILQEYAQTGRLETALIVDQINSWSSETPNGETAQDEAP